MPKATHLGYATVNAELRVGGAGSKGGQGVLANEIPANWYPQNPPTASLGTPKTSDVTGLLNAIGPLVARLAVQYSVALASGFRFVQAGIAPGGTFSFAPPSTGIAVFSAANITSWFDQNINVSELVAIDVVNKNPSLQYDLALRLAIQAAYQIDKASLGNYAAFTNAAIGTAAVTPTQANVVAAIAALPNTGEPVLGIFLTATLKAFYTANGGLVGSQTQFSSAAPLYQAGAAGTRPIRLYASDAVAASAGNRNLVLLPSASAFGSADLGLTLGAAPVIAPGGVLSIAGASYRDPEVSNALQLMLQLVVGNSGSGVQRVYVNLLGAPIALVPLNAQQVLS